MIDISAHRIDARSVLNGKGNYFKMDKRYCNAICIPFTNSENRFYNEKGSFLLKTGNVLFIPQGSSYELETQQTGTVGLINFMGEMNFDNLSILEIDSPDKMCKLFFEAENADSEYMKLSCFYKLVDYIAGNTGDGLNASDVAVQIEYMKKHYGDVNIDNEFLAKMTNISEIYFRRIFKNATGVSPHKYLQNLRINVAKKFLKQNIMSVEEISVKCGFSSVYYFSDAFKKCEGMAPSRYAKMYRFI